MNTTTMAKMHLDLLAVTAERDHWKTNHDNRVRAAKILMDRTDMPLERVGAYKQYVAALEENQKLRERAESAESELLAVREDNHSMMLEIHNLRIERDALAAELAKLRASAIVAAPAGFIPTPFLPDADTRRNDAEFAAKQAATAPSVPLEWREVMAELAADLQAACDAEHPHRDQYPSVMRKYHNDMRIVERARALLQSCQPAPSVPTDEQIHAAYRNALGQSIRERDMPEIRKFARALLQSTPQSPAAPAPIDAEAFETNRMSRLIAADPKMNATAVPAPSVPDDLAATIRRKFISGNSVQVESIRISRDEARALLQSTDHSEQSLEKVAPDCRNCANRGHVNGLSQESYCDSCIYQDRDWRQNHFVDARKMADAGKHRCEACAVLPCSCK